MNNTKNVAFVLQKSLIGLDLKGYRLKYCEAIGYFTDLKSALSEKKKHPGSFVFPFECRFHAVKGNHRSLIRAIF